MLPLIEQFLESIGFAAEQAPEVLREISSENGLLREQGVGYYGFLHLTIQEYLVAEYVSQKMDLLLEHLGDSWWEEVTLLAVGQTRDAGPLLQHLNIYRGENEIPEDIFYSKLILAGRCLAARPVMSEAYGYLRKTIPAQLFDILFTTPYSLLWEQITETLAEIGGVFEDMGIHQRLLSWLDDEFIDVKLRGHILAALGKYGSQSLSYDLFALFINKRLKWAGYPLVETVLGNLCDQSVLPELFNLLYSTKGDYIDYRQEYGHVDLYSLIGRIGGTSVIAKLMAFFNVPHLDLHSKFILPKVLGLYGTDTVIPMLIAHLSDSQMAKDCIDSLLLLNNHSVGPMLVSELTNKKISIEARAYIAATLVGFSDEGIKESLMLLLDETKLKEKKISLHEEVKAAIAGTLVKIGDKALREHFFKLVIDAKASQEMSTEIIYAFADIGDTSIIPQLHDLKDKISPENKLLDDILIVLGQMGDKTAITCLVERFYRSNDNEDSVDYEYDDYGEDAYYEYTDDIENSEYMDEDIDNESVESVDIDESVFFDFEREDSDWSCNDEANIFNSFLPRSRIMSMLKCIAKYGSLTQVITIINNRNSISPSYLEVLIDNLPMRSDHAQSVIVDALLDIVKEDDKWMIGNIRQIALRSIGQIAYDEETVERLIALLPGSDIADDLYETLWHVSRRLGIWVVAEESNETQWNMQRW
ncbi:hypothetical protein KDW_39020 [Dictyobacter vulcani]|uniref:HEAT repeat domain-containing protein n=1 Tax=Dictyobacter vulcani TaxID=2607529 RepID=A0A5J4KTE5_9CHLR|nr:hypothetical protein KDW_39020 [Dictyobacter vulcani]